MANPFLEDFLKDLQEMEQEKTTFGATDDVSFFPTTLEQPQAEKNVLYDIIGSSAWAFADEAAFGGLSLGAYALDKDVSQFAPQTLPGKIGAGIGALGGFALGAPLKVGGKILTTAAKPFLQKAVAELGEDVVVGSAKTIAKKASKEAVDTGLKKEIADDFTNQYLNLSNRSTFNKDIAKDFVLRSSKSVDDLANSYVKAGKMTADEADIARRIFQRDLTKRPIQNFKDLWGAQGGNPWVGNLLDEAIMFTAIDAIREVPASISQERPYDFMMPVIGTIVGAGFGGIKFLDPVGKSSNFRVEMADGIRSAFGRNIYANKKPKELKKHAAWLAGQMQDNSDEMLKTARRVNLNGKEYKLDLMMPEQVFSDYGDKIGTAVLRKGLDEYSKSYGKELLRWSLREEWDSLTENWFRMFAGGMVMNAHALYQVAVNDAELSAEDMIPGMLIGAWMNRNGTPRAFDLHTRTNRVRKNLHMLGHDVRNMVDVPSFSPYNAAYMNPISQNEALAKVRDKAEELGIITDSYEQSIANIEDGSASVLFEHQSKGGYDVFNSFYHLLGGQKKFIKGLDQISLDDAKTLQNSIKELKWDALNNKSINNAQDLYHVVENISEGAAGVFEKSLVNTLVDMKIDLPGLIADLDPSKGSAGSFIKEFTVPQITKKNQPFTLSELAESGQLIQGLEGEAADRVLKNVALKANRIIDALANTNRIKKTDSIFELTTKEEFEALRNIVEGFEARVNRSVGSKEGLEFNILNHMEDMETVMFSNNVKTSAKNISTLFTQGSKNHIELQTALKNAGILHGDNLIEGGLVSIPDLSLQSIEIVGGSETKIAESKRALGQILSIIKAKAQYNKSVPKEPLKVDVSQVDALLNFLGKTGMKTQAWVMDQWNGYTLRYIMNENIEGSNITMQDMNTFMDISSIEGLDLAKVSPKGRGFEARKIEIPDTNNEVFRAQVDRYNKFIDKIIKDGSNVRGGLISKADPITVMNPELMHLIDQKLDYSHADAFASARQAITDFTNSVSINQPAFIEQMRTFSSMNADYAKMLEGWLISSKVISRERPDGYIKYRFNEDGLTPEVIDLLKSKMNLYGVSYDHIDAQYKQNREEYMDIMQETYAQPHADGSLTQDQFFNKYYIDESGQARYPSKQSQDELLSLIDVSRIELAARGMAKKLNVRDYVRKHFRFPVKTNKGTEYKLGSELDLRNVKNRSMVNEAMDHLSSIISAKTNATEGHLILWDGGASTFKKMPMQKTKFTDAMEKFNLPLIFISGSGENFGGWGSKRERRRVSLFESDSRYLTDSDKRIIRANREAFEKELGAITDVYGKVSKDQYENSRLSLSSTDNPGMDIFVIGDKIQPIGIGRSNLPLLTEAYENLFKKVKGSLSPGKAKEMQDNIDAMKRSPNMKIGAHEQALRQLLFSEISIEGNNYSGFASLMDDLDFGDNGNIGKISKRLSLFHTPNFKKLNPIVTEGTARNANDSRIIDKYNNILNNKARVAILDDDKNNSNFSIKQRLKKQFQDKYGDKEGATKFDNFWTNELHGRADETRLDSVSFLSKDMMRYFSLGTGRAATDETQLFKPVISSTGDVLLLGKTVFVHDPALENFFKTQGLDILTTGSASKVVGPGWNKIQAEQLTDKSADLSGSIRQIDMDNIRIKQDRVHTEDTAKQSQSAFNYMSSAEAEVMFNEGYATQLRNNLEAMNQIFNNPDMRKMFFDQTAFEDQSIQSMFEGGEGGAVLGAAKFAASNGMDPLELGDRMFASQLYRKFIDPIVNKKAEINGSRYGGKAVLMQSLTGDTNLRATIVEDGQLTQYGQVVLPEYEVDSKLSAIKEQTGMSIKVIRLEDQKVLDISELPLMRGNKNVGTKNPLTKDELSEMTLGHLHQLVNSGGEYEVAIVTNRYPRTRPNDMAILGLKGFLTKDHGNAMIVNEMDVLNIFEGDYDVDKNDYYFMQSDQMFKHIDNRLPSWAQGVDVDQFAGNIENLSLSGTARTSNMAWSEQLGNATTLKKGIGVTQKLHRTLNWLRDIAEQRVIDKETGETQYVLMQKADGSKIVMDYDNKDWWHRAVLETQAIIDAGTSANGSLINESMKDYRDDFLFPLIENSHSYLEKLSDNTNRIGFLRDIAQQAPNTKRIRLFRKLDKDGKEVSDLSAVDKDVIKTLLNQYAKFISIGSTVFDKTGNSKKPGYNDVMDLSEEYFSFLQNYGKGGNMARRVFYKLLRDHGNDAEFAQYFGKDLTDAYTKDGKEIPSYAINTRSPFPEAMLKKADDIANGKHGNVLDRMMHKVRARDPLGVNDYKAFNQADLIFMDEASNRFMENPEHKQQFNEDILAYTQDINKKISQIRYLKRRFGFINNMRVSAARKQQLKNDLNETIRSIEATIADALPSKYKKTFKGEDLKAGYIKIVDLQNNNEMKNAAVQLYAMDAIARINDATPAMKASIQDLHHLERRMFGDMNDLSYTQEYGDASIVSNRMKDYLKSAKLDYNNIESIINDMITKGVQEHGMHYLWHYANPKKNPYAVGVFNNQVVPVPYSGNGRMKRVIRHLANMAQNPGIGADPDALNAFRALGSVIGHYRNYFNRNWEYLSQDPIINDQITYLKKPSENSPDGLTYEHLRFPSFSSRFESGLDGFRAYKWKKHADVDDPFKTQVDMPVMSFYKQFFDLHGKGAEFDQYVNQKSVLHKELESNRIIDPMRYLAMVSNLDTDIHNFAKNKYAGAIVDEGSQTKVWSMDQIKDKDAMRGNIIYALMGGNRHFKTLTLAPESKRTKRDISSAAEFGKFGQTVMERVSEGTMENLKSSFMHCTVKGSK